MKVIFIKKVPKVGNVNEIKEQPDGYVRNFLVPKGLAIIATPEAIKKLERSQNEVKVEREVQTDLFRKNLRSVSGVGITIKAVTNEQGNLFKAIHAKDIVEALKKQHQIVIEEEFIKLSEPIKQNGTFTIGVEAMGLKESIQVEIVKA